MWSDIAKEWDKIPVETYQFIFNQVKDRFDEVLSESESITNKAIKLTSIAIAAASGFIGYNYKATPSEAWIVILAFIYLGNIFCLGKLMFPKHVVFKGSSPKELFNDYLDNPEYTENDKKVIVYYHELKRYQERIELMKNKNSIRHIFYAIALTLTALTVILSIAAIVSTIYYRP